MSHYPFAPVVLQRLVAAGYPEADAARILGTLFLGPDAKADDLFEVVCTVLRAKLDENPLGSSHVRVRSIRPSSMPPPPAR